MKHYVFIFSINEAKGLLPGMCRDVVKAINHFKKLPELIPSFYQLVFLEEFKSAELAKSRFDEITAMKRFDKEILIEVSNREWVELQPGINIEL